jgi:hypothetical protein
MSGVFHVHDMRDTKFCRKAVYLYNKEPHGEGEVKVTKYYSAGCIIYYI